MYNIGTEDHFTPEGKNETRQRLQANQSHSRRKTKQKVQRQG